MQLQSEGRLQPTSPYYIPYHTFAIIYHTLSYRTLPCRLILSPALPLLATPPPPLYCSLPYPISSQPTPYPTVAHCTLHSPTHPPLPSPPHPSPPLSSLPYSTSPVPLPTPPIPPTTVPEIFSGTAQLACTVRKTATADSGNGSPLSNSNHLRHELTLPRLIHGLYTSSASIWR